MVMDPPSDHEVPVVVLQPVVAVGDEHLPGVLVYQEVQEGDARHQPGEGGGEGEEEQPTSLAGTGALTEDERQRVQLLVPHPAAQYLLVRLGSIMMLGLSADCFSLFSISKSLFLISRLSGY